MTDALLGIDPHYLHGLLVGLVIGAFLGATVGLFLAAWCAAVARESIELPEWPVSRRAVRRRAPHRAVHPVVLAFHRRR